MQRNADVSGVRCVSSMGHRFIYARSCPSPFHLKQHPSFVRGACSARMMSFLLCRPPSRGGEAPRGAHWSCITLARRDNRVSKTRRPVASGTAPLGASPWRFSAAGLRLISGQCYGRISVATCPGTDRKIRPGPAPPALRFAPQLTGRHSSLRLQDVSGDAPQRARMRIL